MAIVVPTLAAFIKYPGAAAITALSYVIGRLIYSFGYLISAKARTPGALIMDIALLAQVVIGYMSAIRLALDGFGIDES